MKNFLLLFTTFFALNNAHPQGWVWQNPLPQGNILNSVYFTDANNGYAAGNQDHIKNYRWRNNL